MPKPTNRLGRGLNALITPRPTAPLTPPRLPFPDAPPADRIRLLDVNLITPNPRQPRTTYADETLKELAASIRTNGILQPVIVRPKGDDGFELVAGERRWRAAKLAGQQTVPAVIRELSDAGSFEIALVENLQREDLAPLERAAAYQHYLDSFGGTVEDLAARLSESRANISNYLRLLSLRPEICYMLGSGDLGMGQARAIAGVADPQRQLSIARLAARRNLSVRQVEALAHASRTAATPTAPEADPAPSNAKRHHLTEVEQALTKALGLRVRLYPGRRKNAGRLVISFATLDEFDRIAERLGGKANLE